MRKETRNVILFLDNAAVHPTSVIGIYINIKTVFLPKNVTSHLQPFDAGIIQVFKTKYRKKLMRYVFSHINDDLFASEIAKGIDILQAIIWVADAWKEVNIGTIKNCFVKYGITEQTSEDEDNIVDEEFNALFSELADSKLVDYVRLESKFSQSLCDFRKECSDLTEVASENYDDNDDDDVIS